MGLDGKTQIPPAAIESVNQNKIGLKGKVFFSLLFALCQGYFEVSDTSQWRKSKLNLVHVLFLGPLATPIGKGHVSLNLTLRRYG